MILKLRKKLVEIGNGGGWDGGLGVMCHTANEDFEEEARSLNSS